MFLWLSEILPFETFVSLASVRQSEFQGNFLTALVHPKHDWSLADTELDRGIYGQLCGTGMGLLPG
jgi:hypothetical protein